MSAPTWAVIVGILMMLVAGCGACNGYQQTQFSKIMEKYPQMMDDVNAEIESARAEAESAALEAEAGDESFDDAEEAADQATDEGMAEGEEDSVEDVMEEVDTINTEMPAEVQEMLDGIFNMSEQTKTWMIRFGYLSIFGAIILFFGGLFLLIPRSFSINLAYAAILITIIISVGQHYMLSKDQGNIMSMISGAGAIVKVVFSLILMAVIFACEKHAYDFEPEFTD